MGSTGRDLHVDVPLSNLVIGYAPQGMVADKIAPVVTVAKQSNAYTIFDSADAFRTEDDVRAPKTEARVIDRNISSGTYYCKNYALKDLLSAEDMANADHPQSMMHARAARGRYIKNKLMLNWEVRCAGIMTSTSNIGSSSQVGSAWTDRTNSDPVLDIRTGINNVQGATGYRPNRIVIGIDAWNNFIDNANVLARLFGSGQARGEKARLIKASEVAMLFEVDEVIVGSAYRNTAQEGQAQTLSGVWGDDVIVYYSAPVSEFQSMEEPSFMYSFRWKQVADLEMQAEVTYNSKIKAEEVEVAYYQDEKVTGKELSFGIMSVNSSQ